MLSAPPTGTAVGLFTAEATKRLKIGRLLLFWMA